MNWGILEDYLGTRWGLFEDYFQVLEDISGTALAPSDSSTLFCGNLRFTLYKHFQVIWGKMDGRATNSLSQTTTSFSAMSGITSPGRSSSTQGAQHPFSSTSATGPFNAGSDSTSSTWYSWLCNYIKRNLILSLILRHNFDFWTQDNRFHIHFCFFSFFFCCQRPWTKASGGPFSFLNFFSELLTLDEGERRQNLWKTLIWPTWALGLGCGGILRGGRLRLRSGFGRRRCSGFGTWRCCFWTQ